MAQRVVKLKPDKLPVGPAIQLRRADNGFGFCVGGIDEKGFEDFRGISEHADYDSALKDAQDRAHRLRIPVKDITGVEAETTANAPAVTRQPRKKSVDSERLPTKLDDLPSLASNFDLPSIDERLKALDPEVIAKRINPTFLAARDEYRAIHEQCYGDTRNHAVRYDQRTHDQVQGQIMSVYGHLLTVQTLLYAHLEAAFRRIAELERNSLTVDGFDAQVANDDRTIELAFGSGEQRQVASFKWPVVIYRGTFKSGQRYEAGDMVTHEGSGWIAQRATNAKPGTPNSGFQLAIKRGRDGKDGNL
jgi:hypothetical protein